MSEQKKLRTPIPKRLSALVLFQADRTCCICREGNKPVQIHHIDDNPSNNVVSNLAVLCLEHHHETQIKGGFNKKLDAEQVTLYRDDWVRTVSRLRAVQGAENIKSIENTFDADSVDLSASLAEIYRENEEWVLLASHYATIGNKELRDKYIERAISERPDTSTVTFLRGLQDKAELIPQKLAAQELSRYEKNRDWTQRARLLLTLGRSRDATIDYLKGILQSLEEGNNFSAAFYLRELVEEDLITQLYLMAYADAEKDEDLWWQVRVFQDLEWDSELKELLLEHKEYIEKSDNLSLKQLLAWAQNDKELAKQLAKEEAQVTTARPLDDNSLKERNIRSIVVD